VDRKRPQDPPEAATRAFSWLQAGIPLTLLLDLASPAGPDSATLAEREGDDGASWLPAPRGAPPERS
jgi:hypothetical protein